MPIDYGSIIAPVVGGILGSQSGAQQAGTTTTTQTPWGAIQPYLVGGQRVNVNGQTTNVPGIADQAAALYSQQSGGMPSWMQDLYSNYMNIQTSPLWGQAGDATGNMLTRGGPNASLNPLAQSQTPQYSAAQTSASGYTPNMASATGYNAATMQGNSPSVGVGRNALLGMDNPYLNNAIYQAQGDISRSYNQTVAPQRDAQMHASGSFGNTGVQQMQLEDQRNLQNSLGNVANSMRMQDYQLQAGLGESDLGRQLQAQTTNAGNAMNFGQFNANALNQAGQYNANAQNSVSLANAGFGNTAGQFAANAGNTANMQNANWLNSANAGNAANQLNNNQFNATAANNWGMNNANLGLANYNAGTNAYTAGMGGLNSLSNNVNSTYNGLLNAGNMANDYNWRQLGNYSALINPMAGMGRSLSEPYYNNPYASALGGAMAGSAMYNNWGR